MAEQEKQAGQKKGFFAKLLERVDKVMQKKAKKGSCCGPQGETQEPPKSKSCCG